MAEVQVVPTDTDELVPLPSPPPGLRPPVPFQITGLGADGWHRLPAGHVLRGLHLCPSIWLLITTASRNGAPRIALPQRRRPR